MKTKTYRLTGVMSVLLTLPAAADVIYSNLKDIGIPADFGGVYLNVETGAYNANIDSPVAGYMLARRGVELEAVYFHSPPHTSEPNFASIRKRW